ncbi:MAG: hypothetical protein HY471_01770 [Candidatus Sungbacteria bacterium]|nr:hypothetical protein [Candidatus Sungbacteria bacterium]
MNMERPDNTENVRLPENLTVEDMVRLWTVEYRDLSEERIPMSPEEIERDLETIKAQLEGLRERKTEVEDTLRRIRSGEEAGDEEALVNELDEMITEIPELEEFLFLLEEGRELYIVQRRQFRRYTKEEAASEAQILQELVNRGVARDYHEAEMLFAERIVEHMLQAGYGWEAIRIAVESGIIGDDIVMGAMDRVEQNMDEARAEHDEEKLRVSEAELRKITEWRTGT